MQIKIMFERSWINTKQLWSLHCTVWTINEVVGRLIIQWIISLLKNKWIIVPLESHLQSALTKPGWSSGKHSGLLTEWSMVHAPSPAVFIHLTDFFWFGTFHSMTQNIPGKEVLVRMHDSPPKYLHKPFCLFLFSQFLVEIWENLDTVFATTAAKMHS